MSFKRYIFIGLLLGLCIPGIACKKKAVQTSVAQTSAAQASAMQTLSVPEEQRFTYYFYAAQQNLHMGQYDQAFSALLLCDAINPNDAKVKEQLGILFEALKQNETAYECFKRAYELDPENCWGRYLVAERVRCLSHNDSQGALAIQDRIDAKKGRDEYSVFLRMRIGELTGMKWNKLAPLYEELLTYNPNNASVLNNYAYGLAIRVKGSKGSRGSKVQGSKVQGSSGSKGSMSAKDREALKKAETMSLQALKQEPNNSTVLDTYGWILHLQGQDQLALFYLRKALENAKEDSSTRKVIEEHIQAIE